MAAKKTNYIIGIDEVGRGALAGPVVVAAVAATTKLRIKNAEFRIKKDINSKFLILNSKLAKLKDSKKLSRKRREVWFKLIKQHSKISYATANISPKIIDKINISQAANLAATRALNKLTKKLKTKSYKVFLDGGLYLNNRILNTRYLILNTKTIIRGDEKIPAISLASIVAKVSRDRIMRKLHKKYPRYDFIHNVGYGTKKHIETIKKHGRLPIHRKSFNIK